MSGNTGATNNDSCLTRLASRLASIPANTGLVTDKSRRTWREKANDGAEHVDRFLRFFGTDGLAGIGLYSSQIAGTPNATFSAVGDNLASARFAPSVFKSGLKLYDVVSLNMFFRWGSEASWLDIAMDVCLVVARFLCPLCWLNRLKAINLGKHANGIGMAVSCGFAATTFLCFVQSISTYANNDDPRKDPRNIAHILFNAADTLAAPWECGFGFMATPVMCLVGAILSTIACALYFVTEWFFGARHDLESVSKVYPKVRDALQAEYEYTKDTKGAVGTTFSSFAEYAASLKVPAAA